MHPLGLQPVGWQSLKMTGQMGQMGHLFGRSLPGRPALRLLRELLWWLRWCFAGHVDRF